MRSEDITVRLRYHTATLDRPLCTEAADEIERLRAALATLISAVEADGEHFADDKGSDCSICAALHEAHEALQQVAIP